MSKNKLRKIEMQKIYSAKPQTSSMELYYKDEVNIFRLIQLWFKSLFK